MYKDLLKNGCEMLAIDPLTRFIGYNLKYGSKNYGIMSAINESQIIETPVAENLMMSLAVGMALEGFKPVVVFERHDFILNAMDAIVNHLDKIKLLSNKLFNPKVIIKATVGCKKPFDPGIQHLQDYTSELMTMTNTIDIYKILDPMHIIPSYKRAWESDNSSILVDYRGLYDTDS